MKRIISVLAAAALVCLSGCNLENEGSSSRVHKTTAQSSEPEPVITETPKITTASTAEATSLAPTDVIPEAVQTPRVDGNRLSYSIMNIYSDGDYYTLEISGVKYEDANSTDIDTTYVKGELYGDFRLDLMKRGEVIDSLKINVPRDDRFLILESVTDNLSYGCELISNKRMFDADEYPDLVQLDFYMVNEVEVPQYARYFAVFDKKICEVPVYEYGREVAPYGTHPEMKAAGLMTQNLVVEQYSGNYTVIKYEYTFDAENRCLNRQQVQFTGWGE